MVSYKKKSIFLAVAIILILFIFFCFLIWFIKGSLVGTTDKSTKSNISVEFTNSQNINLVSKLPLSDTLGKASDGSGVEDGIQGYVEFSVENKDDTVGKYEIYLKEKNDYDNNKIISNSYIDLYLTDTKNNPLEGFESNKIPTFNSLTVLDDIPEGKLLYSGELAGKEVKKFILRSWLSDSYGIGDYEEEFNFEINVRGA